MVAQAELLTRADVPVEETWDLSTIYPTDDDWDADADKARAQLAAAVAHRGSLGESAARLRQALDDVMAVQRTLERLAVYASLRKDEDTANTAALARYERATALSIEAGEALAFLKPEVMAIDPQRIESSVADPALAPYRHLLDDLLRHRPHTRSVEVEELLAQNADVSRTARDVFNALDNVDLDFGTVLGEDGLPIALTKSRYQLLLESKNRDVRRGAYDALVGEYHGHRHTLAQLHAGSVRKDVFYARAHNFATARQASLFDTNIPEQVYDSLIEAVREARPAIERYLRLRRRLLGVDELAPYDLHVPLAPQPDRRFDIAEARDLVLDALRPLGDDYVRDLAAGFDSRWVDWHETKGKRSGAYSWGVYSLPPVILMNWNGSEDHVFTLAHEAGHAMHSLYADAAQPFHDAGYSLFTAEIASTVNEVLLTWHLLRETPPDDDATRFSILNRFADAIHGTLLRQTMFAEFEHRTHTAVESGRPLTIESLNDIYGELVDAYLPGVANDEYARIAWSRVPHFYRAFYVYQYATGISAAVSLARAIRDERAPAAARYLAMLRAGGSDYPLALLQRAGVDLTTPEPVRAALQEFDNTVAEMEQLVDSGVFS
ncbi:MAG TPA: oligoendopeptidase F [Thermomicrobiales bacterium]|nr:oligoendopeptidase F [Thermomicrobiales bacterium]